MFRQNCISELSKIRKNATFLTIHRYINEYSEVSDFSITFHVNYKNALNRSKEILTNYRPDFKDCDHGKFTFNDLLQAKEELLNSFDMSLTGYNPLYTCHGVYEQIIGADGKPIPGIKLHSAQGYLHLEGFRTHKKILIPGIYPADSRFPLTKAKDYLRSKVPIGSWGQFKLSPGRFERFVVEKRTVVNV